MRVLLAEGDAERTAAVNAGLESAGCVVVAVAPEHIRSDRGPEFIALVVKEWLVGLSPSRVMR